MVRRDGRKETRFWFSAERHLGWAIRTLYSWLISTFKIRREISNSSN